MEMSRSVKQKADFTSGAVAWCDGVKRVYGKERKKNISSILESLSLRHLRALRWPHIQ
jgi:hypothetical protein